VISVQVSLFGLSYIAVLSGKAGPSQLVGKVTATQPSGYAYA